MSIQWCISQFATEVEHVDFVSCSKMSNVYFYGGFFLTFVNGRVETYGKTSLFQYSRLKA